VPPRANRPDGATQPNGAGPDEVADQVLASERCAFCGCALNGEAAEQIGRRWYHAEACAAEHRKNHPEAPPPPAPKKRSRIKRPGAS
jgi:hypothetical protein